MRIQTYPNENRDMAHAFRAAAALIERGRGLPVFSDKKLNSCHYACYAIDFVVLHTHHINHLQCWRMQQYFTSLFKPDDIAPWKSWWGDPEDESEREARIFALLLAAETLES